MLYSSAGIDDVDAVTCGDDGVQVEFDELGNGVCEPAHPQKKDLYR